MSTKKQAVLGVVIAVALTLFVPVLSIAGDLDPSAAPAPTMKTLDEIPGAWSQTVSCGNYYNCPRFQIVLAGAGVLDKETGLVWEQSPNSATYNWITAMNACQNRIVGNRKGWRLPKIEELSSLVDPTKTNSPFLPLGHPFTNVQYTQWSSYYWSATTVNGSTTYAWVMHFGSGAGSFADKAASSYYVWCVRGGQGYDGQ